MEIPTADTHIATNAAVIQELLYERLIERGLEPHVAAMDAEGNALLLWLNESGGDDTYVDGAMLTADEGDRTSSPTEAVIDDLAYPVLVFIMRRGTGIPEGTEVSFSG